MFLHGASESISEECKLTFWPAHLHIWMDNWPVWLYSPCSSPYCSMWLVAGQWLFPVARSPCRKKDTRNKTAEIDMIMLVEMYCIKANWSFYYHTVLITLSQYRTIKPDTFLAIQKSNIFTDIPPKSNPRLFHHNIYGNLEIIRNNVNNSQIHVCFFLYSCYVWV